MVISVVLQRLKATLVFLINLIKRSVCCFRRRRKSSVDCVPLTGIGIIPNIDQRNLQDVSWKDWDEEGSGEGHERDADRVSEERAPPTGGVHYQIDQYRRQHPPPATSNYYTKQQPQPQQQDFFQDMEPEIKRQTTMLIKLKGEGRGSGGGMRHEDLSVTGGLDNAAAAARLACQDHRFTSPEELGSWEEGTRGTDDGSLWSDADLGWDVVLRQQRKMERHQRRISSSATAPATRSTLGAKIPAPQQPTS